LEVFQGNESKASSHFTNRKNHFRNWTNLGNAAARPSRNPIQNSPKDSLVRIPSRKLKPFGSFLRFLRFLLLFFTKGNEDNEEQRNWIWERRSFIPHFY
jgi:hypothetical protein